MRRRFGHTALSTTYALSQRDSCALAWQRKTVTTAAFVHNITAIQKEIAASEQKRQLQQEGRALFERETLDDWTTGGLNPGRAATIAQAASSLKISPARGQVYSKVVEWALRPDVVPQLDPHAIGRVLHSSLVLSDAHLFELLFSYLWRVVEVTPTMNGVAVAMIINAYGRAGVCHEILYQRLCDRAAVALKEEDTVTIAHIANVAHALSKVKFDPQHTIYTTLREQCIKLHKQGVPLVWITLLDAFAALGVLSDEFPLLESQLMQHVEECSAPLITTILTSLVKANKMQSPLFNACATRAARIAATFDASSISKSLEAFFQANHCSEEFFGTMAERACRITSEFRTDEIRITLRALSHFDLFDAELFPLLAARFISLLKHGASVVPEEVVGVLSSFAAVHERHDELVHCCSTLIKPFLEVLPKHLFTELLWAFAELNVRNETTRSMVALSTQDRQKRIEDVAEADSSATERNNLLQKRLECIKQVFGI